MSEERIDENDVRVLAEYGRTMLSVQLFELSLLGLVQINQPEAPEDVSFDEGWRQVEPLFRMTAGQLRRQLEMQGSIGDDLLEETQTAVNTRNTLAHYFLLDCRMGKFANAEAHEDAIRLLQFARGKFQELRARLDTLTQERAAERGWDINDLGGLTDEDLRRILMEDEPDDTHS